MIEIGPADPRAPGCTALLRESHALMQSLFPAEANHYLEIDALCAPDIRFFAATKDGETLATAALALKNGYGEVKSMFVAPAARGQSIGLKLLETLETAARAENLALLRLETGDTLHAAHRLYARAGFTPRGPFGDYPDAPTSRFMEKRL
jgi:putative acetyltransferase